MDLWPCMVAGIDAIADAKLLEFNVILPESVFQLVQALVGYITSKILEIHLSRVAPRRISPFSYLPGL